MLHEKLLLLTVETSLAPQEPVQDRLHFEDLAPGVARAVLTFGFRDQPDVPAALTHLPDAWKAEPMRTSYVLGRQSLVPAANPGMARWREALFGAMVRRSGSATAYYRLPAGRVVELGSQVQI